MATSTVSSVNHTPPPQATTQKPRPAGTDEANAAESKKRAAETREKPQSNRASAAGEINMTA